LVIVTYDIVPPMKGVSFWLTLELVRIVDFCCVWGWYRQKHDKVAWGQVGTCSVGLVGSMCQLISFSVGDHVQHF